MFTSFSAGAPNTSHDFVRILRLAPDPPVVGGLSKIEIAQEAWANSSFYVPGKSKIIADWILSQFLKDKAKAISLNSIFDARYWKLLSSLFEPEGLSLQCAVSPLTKVWLTPLLRRVPLGPIIVAFLGSLNDLDEAHREDLINAVNSCLLVLWPIVIQRTAAETLQECFGAILSTYASLVATSMTISEIGYTICNSYKTAFINSSNKKKLYQSFVQVHLDAWIQCVENCRHVSMKKAVLDAGVETLFNVEILRHHLDSNGEGLLLVRLQELNAEDRDLVLKALPIIYSTYVNALKKNRVVLFDQSSQLHRGSSLGQLHRKALHFFTGISSLIDHSFKNCKAWATRLALLQTICHENISTSKSVEAQETFNQIIELALVTLKGAGKEDDLDCCGVAVSCLSTIARIDHDLILPFSSRILPLLLHISIPSKAHFEFLNILLDYHIKTRTMGTFVQSLLSAISDASIISIDCLEAYRSSLSSPIMHNIFLNRLSKTLQIFLTESQCQTTICLLVTNLTTTWHMFEPDYHPLCLEHLEGPKEECKTENIGNREVNRSVVAYALICRLASVVLSSLPMRSISLDTSESVRNLVSEFRSSFITETVFKLLKTIKKCTNTRLQPSALTLGPTLKLLYDLSVSRNLSLPFHYDERIARNLMDLVASDNLLPELSLEVFRILFYYLSCRNELDKDKVIGYFLRYLRNNLTSADIDWSGKTNQRPSREGEAGSADPALALLHLVVERWLPVIDRLASPKQIKKLLQTVISFKIPSGNWSQPQEESGVLLTELFHSAEFWEFRSIRDIFLSLLDEVTAPLASTGPKLLDAYSIIGKEIHVYRHLLLFPMEYFPWKLLTDLAKRCISADMALGSLLSSEVIGALTIFRMFLKRVCVYSHSVSHDLAFVSSEFLIHLIEPPFCDNDCIEFIKATSELVEIYLTKLLKASKKNNPKPVLNILASIKSDVFCEPLHIPGLAVNFLASLLERDFPPSCLPVEIFVAIGQLYQKMLSFMAPKLDSMLEIPLSTEDEIKNYSNMVSGWRVLLGLHKWLSQEDKQVQNLQIAGRRLALHLVPWLKNTDKSRSGRSEKPCIDIFAILLQELDSLPDAEHPLHISIIISTYIVFSDFMSADGHRNMSADLARKCRNLASSDYAHLLSFISESLSGLEQLKGSHLQHLVDLASLASRDHPAHSLVHVQKFASRCFKVLDRHLFFVQGPRDLRLKVLDMINMHCSDQQAALRLTDATAMWLLLSKFLAPSKTHDHGTEVATFHKIISIVSSLIHFRRDLVSRALPQLSEILRQLIFSLRASRPNLGKKQTALVMTNLPQWINAKDPVGEEEAKALGRLIESLTTKTVVKLLGTSSTESPKAESLAKPFSKHAAYVLAAYIENMNDPLCVLSLEIRKGFEAGLFALCSMISEHSRDSLMTSSLDAGGRIVLKALWKEYEKQRYVGKG